MLCTGFFMIVLDTTIVHIAIPTMVDSLRASLDEILWVLNGYVLVYAVLLITAGRLGDLYGQRNMFALGLLIFTAASAYCGFAPDVSHLQAARVIQGVGGALLTPQSLAILTSIFPPDRRGAAFGVWGGVAGLGTVAGPTLGGYLVAEWGWRSIFFVNVPIGVLAMAATFLIIPDLRHGARHRLDVVGVALATAGLFAIVFALIEGERFQWGAIWGPVTIPVLIGAGALLLALFILWERRQAEPLMPLSLFESRNFAIMNWIAVAVSFGMFGLFLPITIYMQSVLGLSALHAGLVTSPISLVSMVVAPMAGRFADRVGGKYILFTGCLIVAAGFGSIALLASPDAAPPRFVPSFAVAGLGMGLTFSPMATVAMRNVSPAMAGAASGVFNSFRQLGGVVGSSVVGAILQAQLASALASRAIAAAGQLPAEARQRFVEVFSQAGRSGLEVGPAQSARIPEGVPADVAAQLQQLAHGVFTSAFVDAMRPSLAGPVMMLLIAALSTLLIERRRRAAAMPQETAEALALAS